MTAYNAREAEDDLDVLWNSKKEKGSNNEDEGEDEEEKEEGEDEEEDEETSARARLSAVAREAVVLWGPSLNPFRSLQRRVSEGLPEEPMFENCIWFAAAPRSVAEGVRSDAATCVMMGTPQKNGNVTQLRTVQRGAESLVTIGDLDPRTRGSAAVVALPAAAPMSRG